MHWLCAGYTLKHLPHLLVDNTVPPTAHHLCKLCFTAWRLQRKACVCWGGQISAHQSWCLRSPHWPWGKKPSCFHTAVHRDFNESTVAYCHHSLIRKDSKLPCQELWPLCQYNTEPLSVILPVDIKWVTKGIWCSSILSTKLECDLM